MGRDALNSRFWAKVRYEDCWIWCGSTNQDGYGRFNKLGTLVGAHRFSYELVNGAIPAGMQVLHRCDQPACVNPAHLFLGTVSDNMRDMYTKRRHGNGKPTLCHPELPYFAKGLCQQCYMTKWRSEHPNKQVEYEKRRSTPRGGGMR